MNSSAIRAGFWLAGACAVLPIAVHAELERHPSALGTSVDMGQIVSGKVPNKDRKEIKLENQFITRTGVYLTESGTLNKKLTIQITVGGLFWFPLPEDPGSYVYRSIQGGAGIGQAQASYKFGDPEKSIASLQFGLFPIKYNPDSKNLGEYLYRSGTYPAILYTGGWSYLNSAAYMAQGLRFSFSNFGGVLAHDFTLTMERDLQRNKDLTPAYVFTLKPASFFELGGGIAWAHGVPIGGDSTLSPQVVDNAYWKSRGYPLKGLLDSTGASMTIDTSQACLTTNACTGVPSTDIGYYTFRGFKAMLRASLNPGSMLGMAADAFKLYGEWALLGIADQPFYYDKKSERMPWMFGLNIPSFGLFDVLGVEAEYNKARFRNTVFSVLDGQPYPWPLAHGSDDPYLYRPELVRADTALYARKVSQYASSGTSYDSLSAKAVSDADDRAWHWSVYAKRKITSGMTLHVQAASDHLRHYGIEIAPIPGYFPATERTKDWYYVLRLEFGI